MSQIKSSDSKALKSIVEEMFNRAEEGEIFYLGVIRYYLEEEEYGLDGFTIAKDYVKEYKIEDNFFSGIFFFKDYRIKKLVPTATKVFYKDMYEIRCKKESLYSNNNVLNEFTKELEKK